jgi:hypothetical protein
VNQVGLEAFKHLAKEWHVTQKGEVEAQIFFQGKGENAARQLQRPHISILNESLYAVSRADTQERQIAPPRKSLKVAAGMRHSVYLVKGVGEVGHARRLIGHK